MTAPLSCETLKETFSEVTVAFEDRITAPTEPELLDIRHLKNYSFVNRTCM